MSGSGISWAVCKSAPRSRQITTPAPTTQFFTGRMPFLPPNQQCQSTEGRNIYKQTSTKPKIIMYVKIRSAVKRLLSRLCRLFYLSGEFCIFEDKCLRRTGCMTQSAILPVTLPNVYRFQKFFHHQIG